MKFSQLIGKTPLENDIQNNDMNIPLKNGMWNLLNTQFLSKLSTTPPYGDSELRKVAEFLWDRFFKLTIEEVPYNYNDIIPEIKEKFFDLEWYEVYDFIELIIAIFGGGQMDKRQLISSINALLEREFSAYRFIKNNFAPISNQLEFDEVNQVLEKTNYLTALEGANIHLSKAIELISDKKNPNYRNSVKESISAVESTCRIITGENTLGKALNKLESKGLIISKQLKAGFEKIYAYTNEKDSGIRHAFVESPIEPDFPEAKYMLISCSSFINYLISKAEKIGIRFELN